MSPSPTARALAAGRIFLVSLLAMLGGSVAIAPPALAAPDCPPGFDCLEVAVPLDRSGALPGTLELPVAVQRGEGPVLLALGGGPGQGTVALAPTFGAFLSSLAPDHRIAFFDQRGTGATALECPALQRAALTDLTVPPRGSVEACGGILGAARARYTTTDTVADLDAVRRALGADRIALLGISYGTYVAARYARAHPARVSRLVLDSVVPQENVDPFFRASMRRARFVLRQLCTPRSLCARVTRSPARDLRRLVRRTNRRPILARPDPSRPPRAPITIDGPALFDLITSLASFEQRKLTVFPRAVKRALAGRPGALVRRAAEVRAANFEPDPGVMSWGLHTATLCAEVGFPWGSPATPRPDRRDAVDAAAATIPRRALGPFDRRTATGNGALLTCLRWPATTVEPPPEPGPLPAVPTLIVSGTWDLSTPVPDARREARRSPSAQLAILPEVGHSALTASRCAQVVARRFFADRRLGEPCRGHRAPRRPRGGPQAGTARDASPVGG